MGKGFEKVADKLTDSEKKKIKQANKAKANPKLTAEKQKKKAERNGEETQPQGQSKKISDD
jgi:hypothetical protein